MVLIFVCVITMLMIVLMCCVCIIVFRVDRLCVVVVDVLLNIDVCVRCVCDIFCFLVFLNVLLIACMCIIALYDVDCSVCVTRLVCGVHVFALYVWLNRC